MKSSVEAIRELLRESQKELFGWIPFEEYQALFPTETREKIRARVRDQHWREGVHYVRGSPRDLWIHLANVKAWLEKRPTRKDPLPPGVGSP